MNPIGVPKLSLSVSFLIYVKIVSKSNGQVAKLTDQAIEECVRKQYPIGVITPAGKVSLRKGLRGGEKDRRRIRGS